MILSFIYAPSTAKNLLKSAFSLAEQLNKECGVLCAVGSKEKVKKILENENITTNTVYENEENLSVEDFCEEREVSFLFLQLERSKRQSIKKLLLACRNLRIPYILFKNDFSVLNLNKVIVPVIYLQEEIEKAQFAAAFGRFCGTKILVLQANDYGSKAQMTVEKMTALFDKFSFNYKVEKARGDSYKVENEAIARAEKEFFGIIIISASREYGLDDVIFGAKELRFVKKSAIPVLLVNPRGDLYALCD